MNRAFDDVVAAVTSVGYDWHYDVLLDNSQKNVNLIGKSIRELRQELIDEQPAIVVSAGPSLHKTNALQKIKENNFNGKIIAIDGSYIKCLQNGIIPDYVLSLDPHPTRMVRWFGDPCFEENTKNDDYFDRQDLNVEFRNNSIKKNNENIKLVNEYAGKSKLVICCTSPSNMVERSQDAGFDIYWWAPLVDNPHDENSLTRKIQQITKLPTMNTGGNVGTAAWIFAHTILKLKNLAVIGMDLGYYIDTPYNKTQTYYELAQYIKDDTIDSMFKYMTFPLTNERFYIDPTYYWYRKNLLDLLDNNNITLTNCTEAGTLFGKNVTCEKLERFIRRFNG